MIDKKSLDTLAQLLIGASMVKPLDLEEAIKSAKRLDVPLERALIMHKYMSDVALKPALEADLLIKEKKVPVEVAIKALILAKQNGMAIDDAMNVLGEIASKSSQRTQAVANPVTALLLASEIITTEQLSEINTQAKDNNVPLGRYMLLKRIITRNTLTEVLSTQRLVQEGKITIQEAVQALSSATQRRVSVSQILFEQGGYCQSSGDTLRLFELLWMAALIPESDFLDCLEIEICQGKSFGQVVVAQNLLSLEVLEAANTLLDMVGSFLKPYQAAEALKSVNIKNISVYQALAELHPPPQVSQRQLRLGDLIVESGIANRETLEELLQENQETPIRIGKRLVNAGLISEPLLFDLLRCQSLTKEGLISPEQSIAVLTMCRTENLNIEDTLIKQGLFVPTRMHWSWV
jgi:hypothetical protein